MTDVTDDERDLILAGLFELRIAHAEDTEQGTRIAALVARLGSDPDTAFFGAYRHGREDRTLRVVEYPADETDEG